MNTYKKRILAADLFERENAKTLYHALIYGSGDKKIGSIVAADLEQAEQYRLDVCTGITPQEWADMFGGEE